MPAVPGMKLPEPSVSAAWCPAPDQVPWGWQSRRCSHRDGLREPTGFCTFPPEPSSGCDFSKEQPEVVASGGQILKRTRQCAGSGRPWAERLVSRTLSAHGYKLHIAPGLLGAWPVPRHHKPLSRDYITYQTPIQLRALLRVWGHDSKSVHKTANTSCPHGACALTARVESEGATGRLSPLVLSTPLPACSESNVAVPLWASMGLSAN